MGLSTPDDVATGYLPTPITSIDLGFFLFMYIAIPSLFAFQRDREREGGCVNGKIANPSLGPDITTKALALKSLG